jgi:arylsulfatase A-like enzyme
MRIAEPVELVDLFPTLTRWLGVDAPKDLEGDDLGALLRGQGAAAAAGAPRYAFSEAGSGGGAKRTHFWSVEDRGSKLIFQLIRKGATAPGASAAGRWQFFDLAQDPSEQRNLVETRPPELRRLRTALEAWMRQSADSAASEEQSDETVRALKALGYLQ